ETLNYLFEKDVWFSLRWNDALYTWSQEELQTELVEALFNLLQAASKSQLESSLHAVSYWLSTVSSTVDLFNNEFLSLASRILHSDAAIEPEDQYEDRLLSNAYNHPHGLVIEALLKIWYRRSPKDGDRLPVDIAELFTFCCKEQKPRLRYCRVLLMRELTS